VALGGQESILLAGGVALRGQESILLDEGMALGDRNRFF
jgi:hypothetical protein